MKKRIVVKIGSSSLTDTNGGLSIDKLRDHVEAIAYLKKKGYEVILISSGAVSAGFKHLGYPTRPVTIRGKQAAAAVGQGLLIQAYTEEFAKHGIICAQLLLTRGDFKRKEQYQNAHVTLEELLKRSVLPIINENDSVSIEELTFGDNDMLSALVSGLVHADSLIILTDINGIYEDNPKHNPQAKRFDFLPSISEELIQSMSSDSGSKVGTGGMKSKLLAAQMALTLGVNIFIGTGLGEKKLEEIIKGKGDGTYIGNAPLSVVKNPKQWIAIHSSVHGEIVVDEGAERAIVYDGKSLLPAGVQSVNGFFKKGDVVQIVNVHNEIIAKGEVNYSSEQIQEVKGLSSKDAMNKVNLEHPEVIHRDKLVFKDKELII